jgi:hypothetical protein
MSVEKVQGQVEQQNVNQDRSIRRYSLVFLDNELKFKHIQVIVAIDKSMEIKACTSKHA